jgi:hypothetical protein
LANSNLSITLTLYKGSASNTETKNLSIACTIISNLRIALTNDGGVVVTDKNGNNGGYGENVTTTPVVYEGNTVSSGWTYNASPASGTNGFTWTKTNDTFKITGMTVDSAALTISATKTGEPTLTTTFIVSKLKQGRGAVSCYVDSSAGDLFLLSNVGDDDTTILTAKIFEIEVWLFNDLVQ